MSSRLQLFKEPLAVEPERHSLLISSYPRGYGRHSSVDIDTVISWLCPHDSGSEVLSVSNAFRMFSHWDSWQLPKRRKLEMSENFVLDLWRAQKNPKFPSQCDFQHCIWCNPIGFQLDFKQNKVSQNLCHWLSVWKTVIPGPSNWFVTAPRIHIGINSRVPTALSGHLWNWQRPGSRGRNL